MGEVVAASSATRFRHIHHERTCARVQTTADGCLAWTLRKTLDLSCRAVSQMGVIQRRRPTGTLTACVVGPYHNQN